MPRSDPGTGTGTGSDDHDSSSSATSNSVSFSSPSSSVPPPGLLRAPSSISQPDRPSPTMISRPSVAFVATHDGMSIVEAIAAAKAKEKVAQAERDRTRTEVEAKSQLSSPPATRTLNRPAFGDVPTLIVNRERATASSVNSPVPSLHISSPILLSSRRDSSPSPMHPLDLTGVASGGVIVSPQTSRPIPLTRRSPSTGSYTSRPSTLARSKTVTSRCSDTEDSADHQQHSQADEAESNGEQSTNSDTAMSSDPSRLSRRSSSYKRSSIDSSKHLTSPLLLDPLTGAPIDRTKKRASVYFGMIEDPTPSTNAANSVPPVSSTELAAATNLLNSLSPLHNAALNATGVNSSSIGLDGSTSATYTGGVVGNNSSGAASLEKMMSAVKVEKVELKTLFKAPTLMQQAKVITAAIILQKQARIAERRAIIKQRQAEAEAHEAELEAAAAEQSAAAREARAKARFERQLSRDGTSRDFNRARSRFGRHLSTGGTSSGNDYSDDDSKQLSASGPTSPKSGAARPSHLRMPSLQQLQHQERMARGSLNFSDFDFSGTGTAWGKDQIGSHLRPRNMPKSTPAIETSAAMEDLTPKIHPTGFGEGTTSDNNGAHHPLMNPTHPNFLSHLNPNSTNYNSHINPKHENYNPLNNPSHPDHDTRFNNPRHALFNPFYKHPKVMNPEFIRSTFHLHGGSSQHPAHPAHPLFTPHQPSTPIPHNAVHPFSSREKPPNHSISGTTSTLNTNTNQLSLLSNSNTIHTPSGGHHKWAPDSSQHHSRVRSVTRHGVNDVPLSSSHFARSTPSYQTMMIPTSPHSYDLNLGLGNFAQSPPQSLLSPRDRRSTNLTHREAQEQELAQELAKAIISHADAVKSSPASVSPASAAASTTPARQQQQQQQLSSDMPPFDPSDPLASLDLSGKTGVPLSKQFARLTYQQVEMIRKEALNSSLGMPSSLTTASSDGSNNLGLSKFFYETLKNALGGDDIWKLASDMHANPNAKRGDPNDPLKGVSLSSLSLQAHMSLFGAGALTDSDGRPIDSNGYYFDVDEDERQRATAIAPFPPKKFFLTDEVERYEAELREQLKKDHEGQIGAPKLDNTIISELSPRLLIFLVLFLFVFPFQLVFVIMRML